MTNNGKKVLEKFIQVNGAHLMATVDDEYARRVFTRLGDLRGLDHDEALSAINEGKLPLPSYVLSDESTLMMYPNIGQTIKLAGGVDCLREWFLSQWGDQDRALASQEWEAYLSGQYVFLRNVTPANIQAKARLASDIKRLTSILDADPHNSDAREELKQATDELDELTLPLTSYDRKRFNGSLFRESMVDEIRASYLAADEVYRMTLSLNVLNHLGINLYSNLPAILSEAVANAWDADATRVDIDIDAEHDVVTVSDNGVGMTSREINERYLNVGYRRREDQQNLTGRTTMRARAVMGRKGIGKLSLFSIAKTIEVQSRAQRPIGDETAPLQRAALELDLDAIMQIIEGKETATYTPLQVDPDPSLTEPGTRLVLTRPRKNLSKTAAHLRRRLARRFAMVSDHFDIYINDVLIKPEDRDLAKRCRYLWIYGPKDYRDRVKQLVPGAERIREHAGTTPGGREVRGWIGSATTSTELKPADDQDETLNRIAIFVRNKLAQEDFLEAIAHGGLFTKFLSGEVYADFLDEDDKDDIATSSRQGILEDDPRFLDFKAFMAERIASIGTDWNKFREEDGVDDAKKLVPAIEEWLKRFKGDTRRQATQFIARVNSIAADDRQRRQLLGSAVIAFERLWRRERLSEINATDDLNLPALVHAFKSIDDVEAAMYYDIVQQRLEIIRKFENLTDENALEKVLQDYLFDHLWLLDPGWDRATESHMEKTIAKLLNDKEAPKDRIDIKYRRSGGEHVIVELKRAGRAVSTSELLGQTEKYRSKIRQALRQASGADVEVQIVCVVGKDLTDWSEDDGRERSRKSLDSYNTRVVLYQELVDNALQAYQEYLDANREVGVVRDILNAMEDQLRTGGATAPSE